VPSVDGADPTGRTDLLLADWRPFALGRTPAPPWMATTGDGGQRWTQDYDGTPVRLTLHCVRSGHEPWTVPLEVDVDDQATR
jgi:hypothetical protein